MARCQVLRLHASPVHHAGGIDDLDGRRIDTAGASARLVERNPEAPAPTRVGYEGEPSISPSTFRGVARSGGVVSRPCCGRAGRTGGASSGCRRGRLGRAFVERDRGRFEAGVGAGCFESGCSSLAMRDAVRPRSVQDSQRRSSDEAPRRGSHQCVCVARRHRHEWCNHRSGFFLCPT